jgi:stage V sporulation protein SpoVS
MESNASESNKYAGLSRWCIAEADGYLRRRNNIQASEKGWGAAAQALKAVAEERGWNHRGHALIVDIAKQVSDEQGRTDIVAWFSTAQALHVNFYEDSLPWDVIGVYLGIIKALLPELERIRNESPPFFTPETRDQHNRWRRLTRGRSPS